MKPLTRGNFIVTNYHTNYIDNMNTYIHEDT